MFGFGDKDKDKLEENMEEIKNLINQDDSAGQQKSQSGEDFEQAFDSPGSMETESPDQGFEPVKDSQPQNSGSQEDLEENIQEEVEKFSETVEDETETAQNQQSQAPPQQNAPQKNQETQSFDQQPVNPQPQPSGAQETSNQVPEPNTQSFEDSEKQKPAPNTQQRAQSDFDEEFQSQKGQEQPTKQRAQRTQEPEKNQQRQKQARNRSRKNNQDSRNLDEKIPEPPKTKELDVPEIEKGPLFIKRQKFENAQRMIQEMRYLSDEIQSVINMLEQGLEEDRKTEKEARELLHNFDENRRNVEQIIHPGEE
ncbi:MAG: hypothetical protein H8Z69_00700 [Nanohaloarchaea archaeon]|nr:hypothetical protein [Candidatus Nanohaloarchaea archaeon]